MTNLDRRAGSVLDLPRAWIALAALALPSAANGNVTAYVDSAGDLWAIGDELDNNLRIGTGGDDSSTFALWGGDASTTVNGQARVTLVAPGRRIVVVLGDGNNVAGMGTGYGGNPSCCGRDLIVLTGGGNDSLLGIGPFPSVFADLGGGNDRILWGEGALDIRRALLRTGDGADVIDIDTGLHDSRIEMGPGNDRLAVNWSATDVQIDMDSGDDRIALGGFGLDIRTGSGNDLVELESVGGPFTLDTSSGEDQVLVRNLPTPGAVPIDPMHIVLGPDDDRLRVGGCVIGSALFDGGSGRDTYLDLANTFAAGAPELRDFEVPRTTLEPKPGIRTRITGRVVAERDAPVPDAVVFLPELGLRTHTDAEGAFRFVSVEAGHQELELVVGADVHGRARSGAALVELSPLETSDAGDVRLEPEVHNILVYGTPPFWAHGLDALLESRLARPRTGYRREEVSRLATLPEDLSPYGAVWHLGSSIPADEEGRLEAFVHSGRGLVLSGGTHAQNDALEALLNRLVLGAGVRINDDKVGGSYAFNPDAVGGVTRIPNVLTTFSTSSFENAIDGLQPENVFFTGTFASTAGKAPGAVWDSLDLVGGRGRLALVVSPLWLLSSYTNNPIENMQVFLQREPDALESR